MEGQEKRLLLVIGISFLFLFVWYTYFMPAPQVPPPQPAAKPAETTAVMPLTPALPVAPALSSPGAGAAAGKTVPALAPLADVEEREVRVETPDYVAVLGNRGGVIKSLSLTRYEDRMDAGSVKVELVRKAAGQAVLPLASELTGLAGPLGFGGLLYSIEGAGEGGRLVLTRGSKGSVVFRARSGEGIELVKTLTFDGDGYPVLVRTEVQNRGASPVAARLSLAWGPGLEAIAGSEKAGAVGGAWYYAGGKREEIKGKKLTGPTDLPLPTWIASHDQYFLAALLPVSGFDGGDAARGQDGRVTVGLHAAFSLAPGTARAAEARLFAGPKEMNTLKAVDPALAEAIDLGWFSIIAKPLLWLLNWLYGFLGNFGLAIITLSVLLKVIFIPANNASFRSMRKMAALQPKINVLRDKYRKDSQKLNTEIMALYKENKVNPAGGCLPILIQIPVFIALYRVLSGAIELRHAPFMLWIGDLSAKDPYYVTPILMGATMFIQQKMTPTAGDPKQAQIMLFLPVIFTAMFISLPSGLVLYWLVTNVLSIAHQWYMLRSEAK
jgi:YidC/Oxa1 family membrane protein insertase